MIMDVWLWTFIMCIDYTSIPHSLIFITISHSMEINMASTSRSILASFLLLKCILQYGFKKKHLQQILFILDFSSSFILHLSYT